MANILKGIDKIVTTSNTEVDLDNIQASGGSAGSSTTIVTAGGLAISKTETADEIGYHFSAEVPFPKADGHSTSASVLMMAGGHDGGLTNVIDQKQFASKADGTSYDGTSHGVLDVGRYNLQGASDGSQMMSLGGWGSSASNVCCLTSFASNSTSSDHGDLMSPAESSSTCSNSTQVLVAGGWNHGNLAQIQMKTFASSAISVNAQILTQQKRGSKGTSDGTVALIMGGWANNAVSNVDHKAFETEEDATAWAAMTSGRAWGMASSNGTIAMYCGGYTGSDEDDCYQLLFADQSTCVDHGLINFNRQQAGHGSDGDQMLIAGGSSTLNTCCMKQFDDNATAEAWGTIYLGRRNPASGSGTP